ncbi:hypothetical protein D7S86_09235 [Pararobbsia silviterrae]|uniref:Uncharacterized protein n=1 Tax=Pararobbsia silviterrae TaxID=1792498 RepID=A0A494Y198_9BURK|nr:hypothetical protein D7S86_09235 [Pararobbsia silviterrae]
MRRYVAASVGTRAHGIARSRGAHAGSALIEVCVALSLLCWVGLMACAAEVQALRMLQTANEYRVAHGLAANAAESLRGGLPRDAVRREYDARARRELRDGRVAIEFDRQTVMTIEIAWSSRNVANGAGCRGMRERACLRLPVGVPASNGRGAS